MATDKSPRSPTPGADFGDENQGSPRGAEADERALLIEQERQNELDAARSRRREGVNHDGEKVDDDKKVEKKERKTRTRRKKGEEVQSPGRSRSPRPVAKGPDDEGMRLTSEEMCKLKALLANEPPTGRRRSDDIPPPPAIRGDGGCEKTPDTKVDIKMGLRAMGLEGAPAVYPEPRQIHFLTTEALKYKTRLDISNCFCAPTIAQSVWWGAEDAEKLGIDKGVGSREGDGLLDRISDEVVRLKSDVGAGKRLVDIKMSQFVSFLFRIYVAGGVAGNFARVGGPPAFLSYIFTLISRGSSERAFTIVLAGQLFRQHVHRKVASGEHVDLLSEAEKFLERFISKGRDLRVSIQAEARAEVKNTASSSGDNSNFSNFSSDQQGNRARKRGKSNFYRQQGQYGYPQQQPAHGQQGHSGYPQQQPALQEQQAQFHQNQFFQQGQHTNPFYQNPYGYAQQPQGQPFYPNSAPSHAPARGGEK